jgi:hypothetical protein
MHRKSPNCASRCPIRAKKIGFSLKMLISQAHSGFVFNLHGVATCDIVRKCAQYCKTCGKIDFLLFFRWKNEPLAI